MIYNIGTDVFNLKLTNDAYATAPTKAWVFSKTLNKIHVYCKEVTILASLLSGSWHPPTLTQFFSSKLLLGKQCTKGLIFQSVLQHAHINCIVQITVETTYLYIYIYIFIYQGRTPIHYRLIPEIYKYNYKWIWKEGFFEICYNKEPRDSSLFRLQHHCY
jgi:hypothetical protein